MTRSHVTLAVLALVLVVVGQLCQFGATLGNRAIGEGNREVLCADLQLDRRNAQAKGPLLPAGSHAVIAHAADVYDRRCR